MKTLALIFVLFALMIWIATVQFLKNDAVYKEAVCKEEMLSYIVELYARTIHSSIPSEGENGNLLTNGKLGKDIYLFQNPIRKRIKDYSFSNRILKHN